MEPRFRQEIQQMMYIAGETQDASIQTIKLIEDIIRDQVVHILKTADDLAARRGSRVISNTDIIFQVRHDNARIERLRTFLTWKAIRKAVKDSEDKEGFVDEAELDDGVVPGPVDDAPASRAKFPAVAFPWDVSSLFSEQVAEFGQDDLMDISSSEAALEKLRKNDERTRDMTVAEYATWSEYRHASLTYRKAKRFREWSGLGVIAENKPNDDVMDILGFLTSEMVQNLTAEALRVRGQERGHNEKGALAGSGSDLVQKPRGLFAEPEGARKAVDEKHPTVAELGNNDVPEITFSEAHLVMNRHFYGARHGLPTQHLENVFELERFIPLTDGKIEIDHFPLASHEQRGRRYSLRPSGQRANAASARLSLEQAATQWTFVHRTSAKVIANELFICRHHSIRGPQCSQIDFFRVIDSLKLPVCRHVPGVSGTSMGLHYHGNCIRELGDTIPLT
ncbi:spt3 [Colletotrichum tabaci]|uniref:Spt3 n=1 Tax=Colletotrichum tabaci TaxID=1209068 RepID=A0AAV9T193_9PEZI